MIHKQNFITYLDSINCCYEKSCSDNLPKLDDFPDSLFLEDYLDIIKLEDYLNKVKNIYLKSVINRMIGVQLIQEARNKSGFLDINKAWKFICESILLLPSNNTISSIGSQGFLSIPLYKFDANLKEFDFLRLHIWETSLHKYINSDISEKFSIHTHAFDTHSWIITGKVINDRYMVRKSDEPTNNVQFRINYNKTLNEVNQHTSTAATENIFVNTQQISHEVYFNGGVYRIKAGDYHRSGTEDELSATFFSFSAKHGMVDSSYVVGPNTVRESEINRKMHIDPKPLLMLITKKLS